ncbi:uncharacterized protein LOC143204093 isoform X3 [Rhynchophorus ferrugineus]|uniref:uncharacterized protein LOC143204093 isoform X3 n=1 Tax=Rhynchophorus ferrugineus TaxID=354439 RepID=UPI003FCD4078
MMGSYQYEQSRTSKRNNTRQSSCTSDITDEKIKKILHMPPSLENAKALLQHIKRSIFETRDHLRRTPKFVLRVHDSIMLIHDYNCRLEEIRGRYYLNESFKELILFYIKLELGVLKNSEYNNDSYYYNLEQRILALLKTIFVRCSTNTQEIWTMILNLLVEIPYDVPEYFNQIIEHVKAKIYQSTSMFSPLDNMKRPSQLTCYSKESNSETPNSFTPFSRYSTPSARDLGDVIIILDENDTGQRVTNTKLKGKFPLKRERWRNPIQNEPNDTGQGSSRLKNGMLQQTVQPNGVNMQCTNASEPYRKTKSPTQDERDDDVLLISDESCDSPISNAHVPPLTNHLPQNIFHRPFSKHNYLLEANPVPNDIIDLSEDLSDSSEPEQTDVTNNRLTNNNTIQSEIVQTCVNSVNNVSGSICESANVISDSDRTALVQTSAPLTSEVSIPGISKQIEHWINANIGQITIQEGPDKVVIHLLKHSDMTSSEQETKNSSTDSRLTSEAIIKTNEGSNKTQENSNVRENTEGFRETNSEQNSDAAVSDKMISSNTCYKSTDKENQSIFDCNKNKNLLRVRKDLQQIPNSLLLEDKNKNTRVPSCSFLSDVIKQPIKQFQKNELNKVGEKNSSVGRNISVHVTKQTEDLQQSIKSSVSTNNAYQMHQNNPEDNNSLQIAIANESQVKNISVGTVCEIQSKTDDFECEKGTHVTIHLGEHTESADGSRDQQGNQISTDTEGGVIDLDSSSLLDTSNESNDMDIEISSKETSVQITEGDTSHNRDLNILIPNTSENISFKDNEYIVNNHSNSLQVAPINISNNVQATADINNIEIQNSVNFTEREQSSQKDQLPGSCLENISYSHCITKIALSKNIETNEEPEIDRAVIGSFVVTEKELNTIQTQEVTSERKQTHIGKEMLSIESEKKGMLVPENETCIDQSTESSVDIYTNAAVKHVSEFRDKLITNKELINSGPKEDFSAAIEGHLIANDTRIESRMVVISDSDQSKVIVADTHNLISQEISLHTEKNSEELSNQASVHKLTEKCNSKIEIISDCKSDKQNIKKDLQITQLKLNSPDQATPLSKDFSNNVISSQEINCNVSCNQKVSENNEHIPNLNINKGDIDLVNGSNINTEEIDPDTRKECLNESITTEGNEKITSSTQIVKNATCEQGQKSENYGEHTDQFNGDTPPNVKNTEEPFLPDRIEKNILCDTKTYSIENMEKSSNPEDSSNLNNCNDQEVEKSSAVLTSETLFNSSETQFQQHVEIISDRYEASDFSTHIDQSIEKNLNQLCYDAVISHSGPEAAIDREVSNCNIDLSNPIHIDAFNSNTEVSIVEASHKLNIMDKPIEEVASVSNKSNVSPGNINTFNKMNKTSTVNNLGLITNMEISSADSDVINKHKTVQLVLEELLDNVFCYEGNNIEKIQSLENTIEMTVQGDMNNELVPIYDLTSKLKTNEQLAETVEAYNDNKYGKEAKERSFHQEIETPQLCTSVLINSKVSQCQETESVTKCKLDEEAVEACSDNKVQEETEEQSFHKEIETLQPCDGILNNAEISQRQETESVTKCKLYEGPTETVEACIDNKVQEEQSCHKEIEALQHCDTVLNNSKVSQCQVTELVTKCKLNEEPAETVEACSDNKVQEEMEEQSCHKEIEALQHCDTVLNNSKVSRCQVTELVTKCKLNEEPAETVEACSDNKVQEDAEEQSFHKEIETLQPCDSVLSNSKVSQCQVTKYKLNEEPAETVDACSDNKVQEEAEEQSFHKEIETLQPCDSVLNNSKISQCQVTKYKLNEEPAETVDACSDNKVKEETEEQTFHKEIETLQPCDSVLNNSKVSQCQVTESAIKCKLNEEPAETVGACNHNKVQEETEEQSFHKEIEILQHCDGMLNNAEVAECEENGLVIHNHRSDDQNDVKLSQSEESLSASDKKQSTEPVTTNAHKYPQEFQDLADILAENEKVRPNTVADTGNISKNACETIPDKVQIGDKSVSENEKNITNTTIPEINNESMKSQSELFSIRTFNHRFEYEANIHNEILDFTVSKSSSLNSCEEVTINKNKTGTSIVTANEKQYVLIPDNKYYYGNPTHFLTDIEREKGGYMASSPLNLAMPKVSEDEHAANVPVEVPNADKFKQAFKEDSTMENYDFNNTASTVSRLTNNIPEEPAGVTPLQMPPIEDDIEENKGICLLAATASCQPKIPVPESSSFLKFSKDYISYKVYQNIESCDQESSQLYNSEATDGSDSDGKLLIDGTASEQFEDTEHNNNPVPPRVINGEVSLPIQDYLEITLNTAPKKSQLHEMPSPRPKQKTKAQIKQLPPTPPLLTSSDSDDNVPLTQRMLSRRTPSPRKGRPRLNTPKSKQDHSKITEECIPDQTNILKKSGRKPKEKNTNCEYRSKLRSRSGSEIVTDSPNTVALDCPELKEEDSSNYLSKLRRRSGSVIDDHDIIPKTAESLVPGTEKTKPLIPLKNKNSAFKGQDVISVPVDASPKKKRGRKPKNILHITTDPPITLNKVEKKKPGRKPARKNELELNLVGPINHPVQTNNQIISPTKTVVTIPSDSNIYPVVLPTTSPSTTPKDRYKQALKAQRNAMANAEVNEAPLPLKWKTRFFTKSKNTIKETIEKLQPRLGASGTDINPLDVSITEQTTITHCNGPEIEVNSNIVDAIPSCQDSAAIPHTECSENVKIDTEVPIANEVEVKEYSLVTDDIQKSENVQYVNSEVGLNDPSDSDLVSIAQEAAKSAYEDFDNQSIDCYDSKIGNDNYFEVTQNSLTTIHNEILVTTSAIDNEEKIQVTTYIGNPKVADEQNIKADTEVIEQTAIDLEKDLPKETADNLSSNDVNGDCESSCQEVQVEPDFQIPEISHNLTIESTEDTKTDILQHDTEQSIDDDFEASYHQLSVQEEIVISSCEKSLLPSSERDIVKENTPEINESNSQNILGNTIDNQRQSLEKTDYLNENKDHADESKPQNVIQHATESSEPEQSQLTSKEDSEEIKPLEPEVDVNLQSGKANELVEKPCGNLNSSHDLLSEQHDLSSLEKMTTADTSAIDNIVQPSQSTENEHKTEGVSIKNNKEKLRKEAKDPKVKVPKGENERESLSTKKEEKKVTNNDEDVNKKKEKNSRNKHVSKERRHTSEEKKNKSEDNSISDKKKFGKENKRDKKSSKKEIMPLENKKVVNEKDEKKDKLASGLVSQDRSAKISKKETYSNIEAQNLDDPVKKNKESGQKNKKRDKPWTEHNKHNTSDNVNKSKQNDSDRKRVSDRSEKSDPTGTTEKNMSKPNKEQKKSSKKQQDTKATKEKNVCVSSTTEDKHQNKEPETKRKKKDEKESTLKNDESKAVKENNIHSPTEDKVKNKETEAKRKKKEEKSSASKSDMKKSLKRVESNLRNKSKENNSSLLKEFKSSNADVETEEHIPNSKDGQRDIKTENDSSKTRKSREKDKPSPKVAERRTISADSMKIQDKKDDSDSSKDKNKIEKREKNNKSKKDHKHRNDSKSTVKTAVARTESLDRIDYKLEERGDNKSVELKHVHKIIPEKTKLSVDGQDNITTNSDSKVTINELYVKLDRNSLDKRAPSNLPIEGSTKNEVMNVELPKRENNTSNTTLSASHEINSANENLATHRDKKRKCVEKLNSVETSASPDDKTDAAVEETRSVNKKREDAEHLDSVETSTSTDDKNVSEIEETASINTKREEQSLPGEKINPAIEEPVSSNKKPKCVEPAETSKTTPSGSEDNINSAIEETKSTNKNRKTIEQSNSVDPVGTLKPSSSMPEATINPASEGLVFSNKKRKSVKLDLVENSVSTDDKNDSAIEETVFINKNRDVEQLDSTETSKIISSAAEEKINPTNEEKIFINNKRKIVEQSDSFEDIIESTPPKKHKKRKITLCRDSLIENMNSTKINNTNIQENSTILSSAEIDENPKDIQNNVLDEANIPVEDVHDTSQQFFQDLRISAEIELQSETIIEEHITPDNEIILADIGVGYVDEKETDDTDQEIKINEPEPAELSSVLEESVQVNEKTTSMVTDQFEQEHTENKSEDNISRVLNDKSEEETSRTCDVSFEHTENKSEDNISRILNDKSEEETSHTCVASESSYHEACDADYPKDNIDEAFKEKSEQEIYQTNEINEISYNEEQQATDSHPIEAGLKMDTDNHIPNSEGITSQDSQIFTKDSENEDDVDKVQSNNRKRVLLMDGTVTDDNNVKRLKIDPEVFNGDQQFNEVNNAETQHGDDLEIKDVSESIQIEGHIESVTENCPMEESEIVKILPSSNNSDMPNQKEDINNMDDSITPEILVKPVSIDIPSAECNIADCQSPALGVDELKSVEVQNEFTTINQVNESGKQLYDSELKTTGSQNEPIVDSLPTYNDESQSVSVTSSDNTTIQVPDEQPDQSSLHTNNLDTISTSVAPLMETTSNIEMPIDQSTISDLEIQANLVDVNNAPTDNIEININSDKFQSNTENSAVGSEQVINGIPRDECINMENIQKETTLPREQTEISPMDDSSLNTNSDYPTIPTEDVTESGSISTSEQYQYLQDKCSPNMSPAERVGTCYRNPSPPTNTEEMDSCKSYQEKADELYLFSIGTDIQKIPILPDFIVNRDDAFLALDRPEMGVATFFENKTQLYNNTSSDHFGSALSTGSNSSTFGTQSTVSSDMVKNGLIDSSHKADKVVSAENKNINTNMSTQYQVDGSCQDNLQKLASNFFSPPLNNNMNPPSAVNSSNFMQNSLSSQTNSDLKVGSNIVQVLTDGSSTKPSDDSCANQLTTETELCYDELLDDCKSYIESENVLAKYMLKKSTQKDIDNTASGLGSKDSMDINSSGQNTNKVTNGASHTSDHTYMMNLLFTSQQESPDISSEFGLDQPESNLLELMGTETTSGEVLPELELTFNSASSSILGDSNSFPTENEWTFCEATANPAEILQNLDGSYFSSLVPEMCDNNFPQCPSKGRPNPDGKKPIDVVDFLENGLVPKENPLKKIRLQKPIADNDIKKRPPIKRPRGKKPSPKPVDNFTIPQRNWTKTRVPTVSPTSKRLAAEREDLSNIEKLQNQLPKNSKIVGVITTQNNENLPQLVPLTLGITTRSGSKNVTKESSWQVTPATQSIYINAVKVKPDVPKTETPATVKTQNSPRDNKPSNDKLNTKPEKISSPTAARTQPANLKSIGVNKLDLKGKTVLLKLPKILTNSDIQKTHYVSTEPSTIPTAKSAGATKNPAKKTVRLKPIHSESFISNTRLGSRRLQEILKESVDTQVKKPEPVKPVVSNMNEVFDNLFRKGVMNRNFKTKINNQDKVKETAATTKQPPKEIVQQKPDMRSRESISTASGTHKSQNHVGLSSNTWSPYTPPNFTGESSSSPKNNSTSNKSSDDQYLWLEDIKCKMDSQLLVLPTVSTNSTYSK